MWAMLVLAARVMEEFPVRKVVQEGELHFLQGCTNLSLTTQGLLRTGRAASPALPGMSGCGGRDKGRNESPHSHFYREVKKSFGGFLGGSDGKEFACNAEDLGWIIGS